MNFRFQPIPVHQRGHANDASWPKVVSALLTLIGSNRYIEVRFRLFQIWRRGGIEWSAPTGNGGHEELARGAIGNEIRTEYCGL